MISGYTILSFVGYLIRSIKIEKPYSFKTDYFYLTTTEFFTENVPAQMGAFENGGINSIPKIVSKKRAAWEDPNNWAIAAGTITCPGPTADE
jgi:hypothetical protein